MRYSEQAEQKTIRAGRVELLYQYGRFALFATLIIAPIIVVLLWNKADQFFLIAWIGAILAVTAARFFLLRSYTNASPPSSEELAMSRVPP